MSVLTFLNVNMLFELLCLVSITLVFDYFQSNRLDICCCVKLEKSKKNEASEGILFKIFKNFYSEALLSKFVRPVVVRLSALDLQYL